MFYICINLEARLPLSCSMRQCAMFQMYTIPSIYLIYLTTVHTVYIQIATQQALMSVYLAL